MRKIKKYQSPSGSLPKRRLKFTPEQIAQFESSFQNKGMNNSEGQKLKEESIQAQQHQEQEKRKEEARIRSRSERPHAIKRKATPAERLRGGGDEYEQTTQVIGMSGRDPLLGTIFDLYVGGKGAESLFKSGSWLYNNGKIIQKSIPYNSENFYRAVGKDAIKDAQKSGIIRSSSKEYQHNPYFSHGRQFWTGERVIEGRQGPVQWVKAKGPNGEYNLDDIIKPGEKNLSSGYVPTEVFPYSNGSTQVLTEGFSYWKKHPIVGWREYKFKQGGKMNTLQFLKNGSGIHIKKKNRGKFTDYCGGKVTDECIRRAKASGNPTLVKRATFADNARHWKHKNGGKAFVEGVNVLDSNPKAYKYVKKKYKMRMAQDGTKFDWASTLGNVGSSILQGYFQNKKISREAEAAKAMNKLTSQDFFNIYNQKLQEAKQQEEQQAKAIEAMTGTTINSSNIVAANNAWKNASGEYAALKNNVDQQNRAIDAQVQAQKSNIWGNAISGVMQQGVGLLSNYLNNKKSSNITTGITTPSITAPSYNYFSAPKKFGTFNNDGSMNLGYNMTYSIDKGIQTKKWSDDIFNKSYADYLK